ncbi:cellulase family glycosylhydrolase, partial [bacterium]|nr:cellulase family glycosylhydrolase [bacterium]
MREKVIGTLKAIVVVFIVFLIAWLYSADFGENKDIKYGVTFSQKYASELNLNWRQVYASIYDELNVKDIRIVGHWDMIEKEIDNYDFVDLDYQIALAERNEAKVILAIGHRTPRWPECHWPEWSFKLSEDEWKVKVLDLLRAVVLRYKDNESVIAWQVENEPYLKVFGECPRMD